MTSSGRQRLFVALDTPDRFRIMKLARILGEHVGGFKVGLEAYTSHGPDLVKELLQLGVPVFLDLKLHDIPNTVAGAAAAATRLGVSFLTVHALGGDEMMKAARDGSREAASHGGVARPRLLAVTILTSHGDEDLHRLGVLGTCSQAVGRLADMARSAGVDGLVCSPKEVALARQRFPGGLLMVPGIRPAGTSPNDQTRVATPAQAVASGADRLVIGRPITAAVDPVAAADAIVAELDSGVAG
jgi:orotidine-5'-phosphate decarboxylase